MWWRRPGRPQRALKGQASGTERAKASVVTGVKGCPLLQLKFAGSQVAPSIAATGRTRIVAPSAIPHHSGSRNPKRRPGNYSDKSHGAVPRRFRVHIYRLVRMGFDPTLRPTGFQTGAQYRSEADGDAACCARLTKPVADAMEADTRWSQLGFAGPIVCSRQYARPQPIGVDAASL